ncbi:NEW3 domain-containing protein [Pyxidicoccus sp. 3LG]
MVRTWFVAAALWLAACSTQVSNEASQRGEWEGALEVLVIDPPAHGEPRLEYFLTVGGQRHPVVFRHGAPEGLGSGMRLKLRGLQVGQQLVADEAEVDTRVEALSATASACGVTGVQRSLVILAAFPGMPQPALTPQAVEEVFFSTERRSLADYWSEVSEGRTTTTGDVVGWYTLDRAYGCDATGLMREAALSAADADVDFTQYDRIFIVHPRPVAGCSYAGVASLSCAPVETPDGTVTVSTAWLVAESMGNHDAAVELVTHEAGHNLSLNHARSRDFGAEPLGPVGAQGDIVEYGNVFSTMGYWNLGHYAAPDKARIGWLAPSAVAQADGVDGTFTLAPLLSSGGVKALKVRRGSTGDGWLWLEYRRPLGNYDWSLPSQVFGGALVHYVDAETRDGTDLLDFTPGTSSWTDPALLPGTTWDDPYSNLSLTVDSATATGLTVRVRYRQTQCVRAPPEVVVTPFEPTAWPGARPEFELAINNLDSPGCGPSTFQLAPIVPQGWGFDRLPAQLQVPASGTGYVTLQTYVPYSMPPGTYAAGVFVTRDGLTVQGTATMDIVERCVPSPPTLTLSPETVTAAPGSDVTWTVSVQNNDSASCNWVWYDFVTSLPDGWETAFSDWGVNLPPGGTFTFTMTKSIPVGASGSHTVDLDIIQEDFGLAASATATVQVVEPPLVVELEVPASLERRTDFVPLSARVLKGARPVAGATVWLTVSWPHGRTLSKPLVTDATGGVEWSHVVHGPGTYRASARVTSGTESATGSLIYSVD